MRTQSCRIDCCFNLPKSSPTLAPTIPLWSLYSVDLVCRIVCVSLVARRLPLEKAENINGDLNFR